MKTPPMYIIFKKIQNNPHYQLSGNSSPRVHENLADASKELRRLVASAPGQEFCLFKCVGTLKAEIQLELKGEGLFETQNNSDDHR